MGNVLLLRTSLQNFRESEGSKGKGGKEREWEGQGVGGVRVLFD